LWAVLGISKTKNRMLKSRWLQECLCEFLKKEDKSLKEEDLKQIKYMGIGRKNFG